MAVNNCIPTTHALDEIRGGRRKLSAFDAAWKTASKHMFSTATMAEPIMVCDRDGNSFGPLPMVACTEFEKTPEGMGSQVGEQVDSFIVRKADLARFDITIKTRFIFKNECGEEFCVDALAGEDRICQRYIVSNL